MEWNNNLKFEIFSNQENILSCEAIAAPFTTPRPDIAYVSLLTLVGCLLSFFFISSDRSAMSRVDPLLDFFTLQQSARFHCSAKREVNKGPLGVTAMLHAAVCKCDAA